MHAADRLLLSVHLITHPNPEDPRSGVSKEVPVISGDALVLRDAASGGPQDEGLGGESFTSQTPRRQRLWIPACAGMTVLRFERHIRITIADLASLVRDDAESVRRGSFRPETAVADPRPRRDDDVAVKSPIPLRQRAGTHEPLARRRRA